MPNRPHRRRPPKDCRTQRRLLGDTSHIPPESWEHVYSHKNFYDILSPDHHKKKYSRRSVRFNRTILDKHRVLSTPPSPLPISSSPSLTTFNDFILIKKRRPTHTSSKYKLKSTQRTSNLAQQFINFPKYHKSSGTKQISGNPIKIGSKILSPLFTGPIQSTKHSINIMSASASISTQPPVASNPVPPDNNTTLHDIVSPFTTFVVTASTPDDVINNIPHKDCKLLLTSYANAQGYPHFVSRLDDMTVETMRTELINAKQN